MAAYWKFKAFGKGYVDSASVVEADRDLPNARAIAIGDVLVRVDAGGRITAVSRVEGFDDRAATRERHRCGVCSATNVDVRDDGTGYCKGRKHRDFRQDRQLTVEELLEEAKAVTRRSFEVTTTPLSTPIEGGVPEALAGNQAKQPSIRPLVATADSWLWTRVPESRSLLEEPPELEVASPDPDTSWADEVDIRGGHTDAVTRRRRNQGQFRKALLQRHGANCAILGPLPEPALDAAHLVSFAEAEKHVVQCGLLLAVDLHRLFDRGLVVMTQDEDGVLLVELAPALRENPRYSALHGSAVSLPPSKYPDLSALAAQETWARGRDGWN